MRVSIVTVCFNRVDTVGAAVDSVLAQDHPDIEYIVVDGGSTDGTVDVLRAYGDAITTLVSEPDEGLYDAINKGIGLATGDVVALLHADDVYHSSDAVSAMAKAFDANPDAQLALGHVVYVRNEAPLVMRRFYSAGRFAPWQMRYGWMPPHLGTFIRRDAYERYGLYRTDMSISADYELLVRLFWRERLPYVKVDRVIVRMSVGGVSTSGWRSSLLLNRQIVTACASNGLRTRLGLVATKIPLKLLELRPRRRAARILAPAPGSDGRSVNEVRLLEGDIGTAAR